MRGDRRRPPPGFPEILAAAGGAASVLDVGCGSGRLAVELAGAGSAVTGIDVSEERLAAAHERADQDGADIRFLHSDMRAPLPFGDGAFAAAVSRLSLMIAPDPEAVLRELARVVVPGGRVVTAVWARVEENPWFGEPRAAVAAVFGAERAAFARVFGRLGDLDELVELHRRAGLQATGTVLRDELRPPSAADHWRELTAERSATSPVWPRRSRDARRRPSSPSSSAGSGRPGASASRGRSCSYRLSDRTDR